MPITISRPIKKIEVISPPKVTAGEGTVYYSDDFDGTLSWLGAGGTVAKDTTAGRVLVGTNSLKITSPGTGVAEGVARIYLPFKQKAKSSKVGIEFWFYLETWGAGHDQFEIRITPVDETNLYQGRIALLYNAASPKLQFYNSTPAMADITDATGFTIEADRWYRMKLIINLETGNYDSVEFLGTKYDLSAEAMNAGANTRSYMQMEIRLKEAAASAIDVFIDGLTLTYDEP